jgi:hypothetical protein
MTARVDVSPRTAWRVARQSLKRYKRLNSYIYQRLRHRRTVRGKRFMQIGDIFPEAIDEIVNDYWYACRHTHRAVTQVLNLESIIRYVIGGRINGAFVECGTYTGGALAFALRSFLRLGDQSRKIYGFDSFEGMPNISEEDGDWASMWLYGEELKNIGRELKRGRLVGSDVNRADYQQCWQLLSDSGYPVERIHLVKGWFQNTLPAVKQEIGDIAVLRLDGDFYLSTKCCLENLFDQVSNGGVVILDDYGLFEGCRKATDEFLKVRGIQPHLVYVNVGIRYFVK